MGCQRDTPIRGCLNFGGRESERHLPRVGELLVADHSLAYRRRLQRERARELVRRGAAYAVDLDNLVAAANAYVCHLLRPSCCACENVRGRLLPTPVGQEPAAV